MQGMGAQLALRFAGESLHVFVASRTVSRLDSLVSDIEKEGGKATAICTDATSEDQVVALFAKSDEGLDLAVYNAGNNYSGRVMDMDSVYFEKSWRVCCYGGFLFGREAVRRFVPSGRGTLLLSLIHI